MAYLIARNGNVSPAAMSTNLKNMAVKNIITGLREHKFLVLIMQLG